MFKGQEIRIDLMDDAFVCCKPYKHWETKRKLIKACTKELFDTQLVNVSNGEYISTTVMPIKTNIISNSTKNWISVHHQLINK